MRLESSMNGGGLGNDKGRFWLAWEKQAHDGTPSLWLQHVIKIFVLGFTPTTVYSWFFQHFLVYFLSELIIYDRWHTCNHTPAHTHAQTNTQHRRHTQWESIFKHEFIFKNDRHYDIKADSKADLLMAKFTVNYHLWVTRTRRVKSSCIVTVLK